MVVAQGRPMCTLSTLSTGMQLAATNLAKHVSFEAFLAEAVGLGSQELRQVHQNMGAEGDSHRSLESHSPSHAMANQTTIAWRGIDLSVLTCQLPLRCGLPWWHQLCFGTHLGSTYPQTTNGSCWLMARLLWPPPMQLGDVWASRSARPGRSLLFLLCSLRAELCTLRGGGSLALLLYFLHTEQPRFEFRRFICAAFAGSSAAGLELVD